MLSQELIFELGEYIKTCLEPKQAILYNINVKESCKCFSEERSRRDDIEKFIKNKKQKPFNQLLFQFIDEKGTSDVEIYKKAGIDRRLFSKIRSNENYHPSKSTAIALAFALELDKNNTEKLLSSAGHALSEGDTFDLIICFFLEKRIYDIYDLNTALEYFSLKPLTGSAE